LDLQKFVIHENKEALPQAFAFKSHCTVDHPATKRWSWIYAKEKRRGAR